MRDWEKNMTLGVAEVLNENAKESTKATFRVLKKEKLDIITPISEIKKIARRYSKKHHVPIRINKERIEKNHPGADAIHSYGNGKSVIYLHPILQYYTPEYIKAVIEHELDHRKVEMDWEGKL